MEKATYLKLDFDGVIYPKFPQSVKAITNWFCSREDIINGLLGIDGGEATKEEIRGIMGQIVPVIIQNDPRKLYEFFDDQGIIISIAVHTDLEGRFIYFNSKENHSFSADNRILAEEGAFLGAFSVLEKELQAKGGTNEERKGSIS